MMNYKKVLVLGFGVTGQAIVNFLNHRKIRWTVIDAKKRADFAPELIEKFERAGLGDFLFEKNEVENLDDYDLILTSPGVPYTNPVLARASAKNIAIKNDITLFLEEWQKIGQTVGVTGSNGKSTIVTLLHRMILAAGRPAILVGNIGRSPLDYLIKEPTLGAIAVLELSSYQLESFKSAHVVDVAIVSNLSPNHLDRYGGDFQKYADAKIKIASPAKTKLIINLDNPESQKYLAPYLKDYKNNLYGVSLKTDAERADLPGAFSNSAGNLLIKADHQIEFDYLKGLNISGEHNLYNIAMCLLAFDLSGLAFDKKTEAAVRQFDGLEHRIEPVAEINGVKYINDSKSTTPDSTRVALESFGQDKNIILIFGGEDKDMNFKVLAPFLEQYVKTAIILQGNAKEKVISLCELAEVPFQEVLNMKEAVAQACRLAAAGEIVLLSPAASSHHDYKNFEYRGSDFKKLVDEIKR